MRGGLRFAIRNLSGLALLCGVLSLCSVGQAANQIATSSQSAPLTITMQDALTRAQANEPQYHAALTEYGVAKEQRIQSRAALLPNVNYDAAFLYTQGNGTQTGRFVGANGVHEYISQGNAHQALSWQDVAEYRRASALEALAKAKSEIAARGLVVAVTGAYYGSVVAQRKYSTAQRATGEAEHFFDITQKLERGGEIAHSDTIKAQLQFQQQQRAL
ncbi:MAG: TolC family protein, partial [Acidobacteria bacterium]